MSDRQLGSEIHETRIAITATFTAEPIEQSLTFWMRELQLPAQIVFAPYNQLFQQLLDPSSLLSSNRGINVILLRFEDWLKDTPVRENPALFCSTIERNLKDLVRAATDAVERSPTPHIFCLCPSSPTAFDPEQQQFLKEMEGLLEAEFKGVGGIYTVSSEQLLSTYPVAEYSDPHAEQLGHVPFTASFFTVAGTIISRKIYALRNPAYKVIALDCDQTLWGGLCGEDGPMGVQLDQEWKAVQEFMIEQHRAGVLLCLCSKNNEEDVLGVFNRPEIALTRDHIIAHRINWKPKSENISSLARELNIGLQSFIFIDDDPVECAEVQSNVPQVLTLRIPREPGNITRFLHNIWALDQVKVTSEASQRTILYKQNLERERVRESSLKFEDFLAGLDLKIDISPLAPQQLARVSELTQRTNQFNFTGISRSEAEILRYCKEERAECLTVQVKDRFGDYGLVGALGFGTRRNTIALDTFLLSCRALGRGVEYRMLARLGEIARERGLDHVEVRYRQTAKNSPALFFLETVARNFKEPNEEGAIFKIPSEVAAQVGFTPENHEDHQQVSAADMVYAATPELLSSNARAKATLISSIATELTSAEQIHKVISSEHRTSVVTKSQFVEPQTSLEKEVAQIWREVLGLEQVGIYDNFFELGGHSLLAVQVLARMRQAFEADLSLNLLFTGNFTVAELASRVLEEQVRRVDPREATAVLKRLSELTNDEAQALLDRQSLPGVAGQRKTLESEGK